MTSLPGALLLLGAIVLAAGCSGGQGNRDVSKVEAVQTTEVTLPKSYRYDPVVIEVKAGETVTWTNQDEFTHDVQFKDGDDTDKHALRPGESFEMTFDEAGTYDYLCSFHPRDMQGRVIVT